MLIKYEYIGISLSSVTEDGWKNEINDKLKIKRELTNACVKKYRKKKCTESQQLNSSMQDDPTEEIQNKQVKENDAEWNNNIRRSCDKRYISSLQKWR